MLRFFTCACLFFVGSATSFDQGVANDDDYEAQYRNVINQIKNTPKIKEDFETRAKEVAALKVPGIPDFPCKILKPSPTIPTSVHRLRPADVKVVGVLGDSISAGTGVKSLTLVGDLLEWRGLSFTGGGAKSLKKVVTVPNFLKMYNPGVTGYSSGLGLLFVNFGEYLNVAVPGNTAYGLPAQAEKLVQRLKDKKNIDYANDWKILTIFIGGNDLCRFCKDTTKFSPQGFIREITRTLDILKQIPRVFLNLLEPVNVTMLATMNFKTNLACDLFHFFGCKCGRYPASPEALQDLIRVIDQYTEAINTLVNSGVYERDDFTVVVQPFFRHTLPPLVPQKTGPDAVDMNYFAADCFHFSALGHHDAALALWNNMFEPVGKKRTDWHVGEELECPTEENPYFFTRKNSASVSNNAKGRFGAFASQYQEPKNEGEATSSHGTVLIGVFCGCGLLLGLLVLGLVVYRRRLNIRQPVEAKQRLLKDPSRFGTFEIIQ